MHECVFVTKISCKSIQNRKAKFLQTPIPFTEVTQQKSLGKTHNFSHLLLENTNSFTARYALLNILIFYVMP